MVESIQNHIDDLQRYVKSAERVSYAARQAIQAVSSAESSLARIPKGGRARAQAAQARSELQQLVASTQRYQQAAKTAMRQLRSF